jgi:hypothetical protein
MALEYLDTALEWLQNQEIMGALRARTTPIVSAEDMTRINAPEVPLSQRPAPAAGRSGSVSAATRAEAASRAAEFDREARARRAARYRLAGEGVKAAFPEEEPQPLPEGVLTQPVGVPEIQPALGGGLPTIQALISGKPSVIAGLFGGY